MLQNRDEVLRVLQRSYPSQLREAGIAGDVVLWLYIDEEGNVQKSVVAESVPSFTSLASDSEGTSRT